jgi:SAM-dependent methyltransferase
MTEKAALTGHPNEFNGKASEYAQYRERYDPDVILPFLREWCGLEAEWSVADIGAGTGMVGDMFRTNGNRVIAIEPNTEMREACAQLHSSDDSFLVADGSAESTGLPDAWVEMIAIGRALHWFHVEPAFREFQRVLKPRGWVTIIACGRDQKGREENLALAEFLRPSAQRNAAAESRLGVYQHLSSLFPGGEFHHAEMAGEMQLDWDGLRGLTLSLSHAPMPDTSGFSAFETGLRGFFDRYEREGKVTFATRAWISAGRFAD